jgi:hypothetical protein
VTAESIARVVDDIRADRSRRPPEADPLARLGTAAAAGPVVDATAIYYSLIEKATPVAVYEDHPCISPPWESAVIAYENEHGNVMAMVLASQDFKALPGASAADVAELADARRRSSWEPASPVDWDRIRWTTTVLVYIGGRSATSGPFPTTGPVHLFRHAVYEDGQPADLFWAQLVEDYPTKHWDMAQLTVLGALNFLNCSNVDLVETQMPRPAARRLARAGVDVTVSEISVFPTGRSSAGGKAGERKGGQRLAVVRGHFASYGGAHPDGRPRGLLFGKHEGRFWHPQTTRGDADAGRSEHDYKLVAR